MYSNVAKLCCFSSCFKVDWLFQEVFFLLLLYVVSFFLFRVASFSPSQKYVQVWNKFVKKKKRKKRESIKSVASILYVKKKKKRKPKLLTYLRFDLVQYMYPGFLLYYFKTL